MRLSFYPFPFTCSLDLNLENQKSFYCQIDLIHIHANQSSETSDHVEQGIDLTEWVCDIDIIIVIIATVIVINIIMIRYYINVEWDILRVPAERHVIVVAIIIVIIVVIVINVIMITQILHQCGVGHSKGACRATCQSLPMLSWAIPRFVMLVRSWFLDYSNVSILIFFLLKKKKSLSFSIAASGEVSQVEELLEAIKTMRNFCFYFFSIFCFNFLICVFHLSIFLWFF